MDLDDAMSYVRRYRDWRRGDGARDFEEAGFTVREMDHALSQVLASVAVLRISLSSTEARLAKCQVQRERIHAQLRSAVSRGRLKE